MMTNAADKAREAAEAMADLSKTMVEFGESLKRLLASCLASLPASELKRYKAFRRRGMLPFDALAELDRH
jgi:hypothetical protein